MGNIIVAHMTLFSILGNIWDEVPVSWTQHFSMMSAKMNALGQGFPSVEEKVEELRNNVQQSLHQGVSNLFSSGHQGASVLNWEKKCFMLWFQMLL